MHTAVKEQRKTAALESLAASSKASEDRLDRIEAILGDLAVAIQSLRAPVASAIEKFGVRLERIESTLRQMNQPTKGAR
jgi:hypothetical protein